MVNAARMSEVRIHVRNEMGSIVAPRKFVATKPFASEPRAPEARFDFTIQGGKGQGQPTLGLFASFHSRDYYSAS